MLATIYRYLMNELLKMKILGLLGVIIDSLAQYTHICLQFVSDLMHNGPKWNAEFLKQHFLPIDIDRIMTLTLPSLPRPHRLVLFLLRELIFSVTIQSLPLPIRIVLLNFGSLCSPFGCGKQFKTSIANPPLCPVCNCAVITYSVLL